MSHRFSAGDARPRELVVDRGDKAGEGGLILCLSARDENVLRV